MFLIHLKFGFMTTKDNLTLIFSPVLPTLIPQHFILVSLPNKCLLTMNIRWFNWSAKHIPQFLCQIFAWFFPVSYGHNLRYGSSALDSFIDFFFCYSTCLVSFDFFFFFLPKYANLSENSYLGSILFVVFEKNANTKVTKDTVLLSFLLCTQQFF